MLSELGIVVVVVAVLFNVAIFFVLWYAKHETDESRRFASAAIAASKAKNAEEAATIMTEMTAKPTEEPEVDEKTTPEYITDAGGERFKVGIGENGLVTLTTDDGKVFEVLE